MTAINHALTGSIIGFSVQLPLLAVIVAVCSHFIMDSLPHFGFANLEERSWRFNALLAADIFLCLILVAVLAVLHPQFWYIAALSAFAATLPDVMWAPGYIRDLKGMNKEDEPVNRLMRFHGKIQWSQTPFGFIYEVAWFAGASMILFSYLRIY